VTPQRYLSGIITEKGILRAPFGEALKRAVRGEAD
jgi:methylthioribose-1-phosphate isomerase